MLPELKIALLGPPQITLGGEPVSDFVSDKALVLLCYLALHRPAQGHPRTTLATLLWGEMPETRAKANLRMALYNLQQLLPEFWITDRKTIALRSDAPLWIDVEAFAAAEQPDEAADLYRGAFLAGIDLPDAPELEEWLRKQRSWSQQQAIDLFETLVQQATAAGRWERAIELCCRLLTIERWRESTHRTLMRLLTRTGQINAALRQYQVCRDDLAQEMGIEPAAETTALYDHLLRVRQRGRLTNLPHLDHPLLGREQELGTLFNLLNDSEPRLITLTGPGGSGKTTLATAVAEAHAPLFLDGSIFVPLADVTTRAELNATIVHTLGLSPGRTADETAILLDYLRRKELLLVFDNVEQLIEPAADLILRILAQAPKVRLLVTSREALHLRAEQRLPLGGLLVPPPNISPAADLATYPAVSLFVRQALKIDPRFDLSGQEAAVADLCRLVEGVPLALELAAGLTDRIDLETLLQRLNSSFDNLTATLRDIPSRHRSLQAVFDTSWALLSAAEQQGLARLGVFYGPFSGEAAATITGMDAPLLARLIQKSLLQSLPGDRYQLHQIVREYAAKRLQGADRSAMIDAHQSFYLAALSAAREALFQPQQAATAQALWRDLDNILAAWRTAVAGQRWAELQEVVEPLSRFFNLAGLVGVAEALFTATLPQLPDQLAPAIRARFMQQAIHFLHERQAYEPMHNLIQELRAHPAVAPESAAALHFYTASACLRQGQLVRCADELEAALTLANTYNLLLLEGQCRLVEGLRGENLGRYAEAAAAFEKAISCFEQCGDLLGLVDAQRLLGIIHLRRNNLDEAYRLISDALEIQNQLDPTGGSSGIFLANLGTVTYNLGHKERSQTHFIEALEKFERRGDRLGEALAADMLGRIAAYDSRFDEATRYFRRALALRNDVGNRKGAADATRHLADLALVMGDFDQAIGLLQETLAIYETLNDPRALGTTLVSLTLAYLGRDDLVQAAEALQAGQQIAADLDNPLLEAYLLEAKARLAVKHGDSPATRAILSRSADFWEGLMVGHTHLALRATLARMTAQAGEPDEALALLAPTLVQLAQTPLLDCNGLGAVYRDCIVVLEAAGDSRAAALREQGRAIVESQLATIEDPAARQRFIENIPGNLFLLD